MTVRFHLDEDYHRDGPPSLRQPRIALRSTEESVNELLIRRKELDVRKTSYTRLVHYEWTYRPRADLAPVLLALVACTELDNTVTTHRVFVFGQGDISVREFTTLDEAFSHASTKAMETMTHLSSA